MTDASSSTVMLSVLSGTICIGFTFARGIAGHEAFSATERSLGLFETQRAAIDAVLNEAGEHHV